MEVRKAKRNFTAGVLSPLLDSMVDNKRYQNGCKVLTNMIVKTQGAASRRSGFQFIYNLSDLELDLSVTPKLVSFIFSKTESYILVFYKHTSGTTRFILAANDGIVLSGGTIYTFEFTGTLDIGTFKYAQSADILYITQPTRKPIELKRLGHTSWTATEVSITDQPSDWADPEDWPQFVGFYEQRIVYGSITSRPQTIWFSKSGDYYDFGVSSPIVASDAATFTLDSGRQGPMQWMAASTRLLVGTLNEEWAVSGSGYEPLSFQSILARKHTNEGSEGLDPLMVGSSTIFLQRLGHTVNQFIFDYNQDSYTIIDLSVLAPHLTENNTIISWDYQQSPSGIVWCVRDDGALLGLTLKREHNVTGWHEHYTNGFFKSVACKPGSKNDELWAIIERDNGLFLEMMKEEFTGTTAGEGRFSDSYLEYEGASTSVLTGLGHLEGQEVCIIAGNAVHPNRTVASGQISLVLPTTTAYVGLPFDSDIVPTRPEIVSENDTSEGRTQIITHVDINLYKSAGFEYGRISSEDEILDLEYEPVRTPAHPTGEGPPLFTGYKRITFLEGHDSDDDIFIRQRQPLPLTIRNIIAHVKLNR